MAVAAAGSASAAPPASSTHLVLIPSYNAGALAVHTLRAARERWNPVWVVVDGSTDGSAHELERLASADAGIRVLVLPHNRGKGAALRLGAQAAHEAGYTHALTLGLPQFDESAPAMRVRGRKICNWWVNLETLWAGIGDSLFGFRVYPLRPLLTV